MKTLRRRLLFWLIIGMVGATMIAGIATYARVDLTANELFDYQLKAVAANLPVEIGAQPEPADDGDPNNDIIIEIWDPAGRLIYPLHPTVTIGKPETIGLSNTSVAGVGWRVYAEQQPGRYVAIAQPSAAREHLAAVVVLHALLPFVGLIPVLTFIIWVVVGHSLEPLQRLAQSVAHRSPQQLEPLPLEGLPQEVSPLLVALNSLLAELAKIIEAQRAFVADAAHELRSPLTALRLQLQLAERAKSEDQRTIAFGKLHERLDRSTHLIEQLLTLARAEPRQEQVSVEEIDLTGLVRQVATDHAALAQDRGVRIDEATVTEGPVVAGHRDNLRIMLGNVVDNALRYSEAGGAVEVGALVIHGRPALRVRDHGPGIPVADRERVFDRFFRRPGNAAPGSGLGLAIVRTIAEHYGCAVVLSDPPEGRGLVVTLQFPDSARDQDAIHST